MERGNAFNNYEDCYPFVHHFIPIWLLYDAYLLGRMAKLEQMGRRLRRIIGPGEADERHLVLAGQVPQHVVGAHLWAGVQRIREQLG